MSFDTNRVSHQESEESINAATTTPAACPPAPGLARTTGWGLAWTPLLIPVSYVNQEMVVRRGTVSGVGHAPLILRQFGRFWGAFSAVDLFVLNALTIITEFVGVSISLRSLGISRYLAVPLATGALLMIVALPAA
jgi:Mn2+/Fe2+ NRAMP family transporter